ncbi:MAG: LPXTG cell wall anchor domain-containing protein [Clostridia bacterium]
MSLTRSSQLSQPSQLIRRRQLEPTDSPKTGDNSNMMMLWIALFVSGNAFVGMILYGRKRRVSDK